MQSDGSLESFGLHTGKVIGRQSAGALEFFTAGVIAGSATVRAVPRRVSYGVQVHQDLSVVGLPVTVSGPRRIGPCQVNWSPISTDTHSYRTQ